jgi:tol-pal system protein YbgF
VRIRQLAALHSSALLAVAVLAPTMACTSAEDMALLHREITDVQREVQRLGTSTLDKTDLAGMNQRMQEATQKTLRSNADLTVQVQQLQEQIEALRASLDLTTRRLQSISQELAAVRAMYQARVTMPTGPAGTDPDATAHAAAAGDAATATPGETAGGEAGDAPAAPQQPAMVSPEQLYQSAYEDYMRGNYDLAVQGFSDYLKRWGSTDLADNAQYWIGECYDAQDRAEEALAAFSKVLEQHPASDKAAAAQLKKGLLYLKLGDQGQGVVHLQYVVFEHPSTEEAELAREKLRSLGLTIR